jgi:transcription elongation factor Elf1
MDSKFVDDNLDGMTLYRRYGCPQCGERRIEFLVEHQKGVLDCASCGCVYIPEEEAKEYDRGKEAKNGTS